MIRAALIGHGAIGRRLEAILAPRSDAVVLVAVLARRPGAGGAVGAGSAGGAGGAADAGGTAAPGGAIGTARVASLDALLAARPDIVVECAGHAALREHGATVLARGHDLLVASVGALADPALEAALRTAALGSGARVLVPSGALGGLDALAAARLAGLDSVEYESTKAPAAWRGTPAETLVDLDALDAPRTFLETDARDAATRFPQNANVAAAVAIAGVGFEATRVRLVADPAAAGNLHRIVAHGPFGRIEVRVQGRVLADNPKSSVLAPHSLAHALLNRAAAIALA